MRRKPSVAVKAVRISLLLAFTLMMALLAQPASIHSTHAATGHYVASLDMTIDPGAEDFVVTSINDAKAAGADNFVLVMNTNGGAGNNMEHIINAISDYEASGNFTTLIAPAPRVAFSAGAFIAEASTKIYMAAGTTIGSATPIIQGIPGEEINSTLTKVKSAFTVYMQELTSRFGRNATATGLMVSQGVSYGASEAYRKHIIDGPPINATNLDGALAAVGVPQGTPVHTVGIRSQVLTVLSDPNIAAILFLLGTFAILADLTHPTLILSLVGGTAMALALVGLGVFGASIVSIGLMLVGALFIFLEIKTHHGISALAGVLIFIIGFLLVFRTPPPPTPPAGCPPNCPAPSPANFFEIGFATYLVLGVIGAGMVVGSLYLYKVREALVQMPSVYDTKSIIGKMGTLTTDLKAGSLGTANIASEDWTVTATEDITKGSRVVVKERQGLKLVVQVVEDGMEGNA